MMVSLLMDFLGGQTSQELEILKSKLNETKLV